MKKTATTTTVAKANPTATAKAQAKAPRRRRGPANIFGADPPQAHLDRHRAGLPRGHLGDPVVPGLWRRAPRHGGLGAWFRPDSPLGY